MILSKKHKKIWLILVAVATVGLLLTSLAPFLTFVFR